MLSPLGKLDRFWVVPTAILLTAVLCPAPATMPPDIQALWEPGDNPGEQLILVAGRLLLLFAVGATVVLIPAAIALLAVRGRHAFLSLQVLMMQGGPRGQVLAMASYVLLELAVAIRAMNAGWDLTRPRSAATPSRMFLPWITALLLLELCRLRKLSWDLQAMIGLLTFGATILILAGGWLRCAWAKRHPAESAAPS
ncbi:MAG: hypothetical protein H6834_06815 [Planctomycetes bacterium]|nr:hypothetical protein [Planctomycetota bacterium]